MKRRWTSIALVVLGTGQGAGATGLDTFTLPAPAPGGSLSYSDVQTAFPGVSWGTLDRLYLPAGHWAGIRLGNLPIRTPEDPLVITNIGGQVRAGGLGVAGHALILSGGANWKLTGEWDPVAETGDSAFQGHAGGYTHSAGTYGIFIDDAFLTTGDSGLVVGSGATDFEIAFVEITRVGFAGAPP